MTPPAVVKVVELPVLPDHGDLVDWIDAHGDAAEPDELRKQVEALADQAEAIQPDGSMDRIERFQPFPTVALAQPIRGFVEACAKAIGCDPSYVALPLLSVLAGAIGSSRLLQIKRGWTAPAILWTVCIGESGSGKTPPFRLVMQPIRALQQHAIKTHNERMDVYKQSILEHDVALSRWKKKTEGDPPTKPDPPPTPRLIVSDTTVEALASVLQDNPHGVLLARDELSGWFGSFDRYAGGKLTGDTSHWLSMHNGETLIVDRKTGQRLIVVPHASVSIAGGIQPAILARAVRGELRESGLLARLLMAYPPRRPKRWSDDDIRPELMSGIELLIDQLRELQPNVDTNDDPEPVIIRFSPTARTSFIEFCNQHADEQFEITGDLASVWSKLEEAAARLALVHSLTRWAGGEAVNPTLLDDESMQAGITLARWFGNEARRVYSMLDESDSDREDRRLVEWIERKGGSVTVREVQQGQRKYRLTGQAEAALEELAKAGWGHWHSISSGPKGGRPSREFRLSTVPTSTQPPKTLDSEGFVDVDSVDAPESLPDGEWGKL